MTKVKIKYDSKSTFAPKFPNLNTLLRKKDNSEVYRVISVSGIKRLLDVKTGRLRSNHSLWGSFLTHKDFTVFEGSYKVKST